MNKIMVSFQEASLGVMNDSDNAGERSVPYIDYIEILRN